MSEQVLVCPRSALEVCGLQDGLHFNTQDFLKAIFVPNLLRFMPREEAEVDPAFKQIIPYVLLRHGDSYFTYRRGKGGGEARLKGKVAIGVGGHINPGDMDATGYTEAAYRAALLREINEELYVDTLHSDKLVAVLNDDSNPVGRVHLGLVHVWELQQPKVRRRESQITETLFMFKEELRLHRGDLETWSQLCVDQLEELEEKARMP